MFVTCPSFEFVRYFFMIKLELQVLKEKPIAVKCPSHYLLLAGRMMPHDITGNDNWSFG